MPESRLRILSIEFAVQILNLVKDLKNQRETIVFPFYLCVNFLPDGSGTLSKNKKAGRLFMWKNSVKRALISSVCLGSLLWPYEAESAPRSYDNRRVRREKQMAQQWRAQSQRTTQRPIRSQPKQGQPSSQVPNVPPERKLSYFKQQILNTPPSVITAPQKKILIEILDTLHSVPRGRWIIENAPADLKFRVNQKRTSLGGSYGGKKWGITISGEWFRRIQNASPEERGKKVGGAALTIAHEMTHAIQEKQGMSETLPLAPQERITLNKLMELHAILEERTVSNQFRFPAQTPTEEDWVYLLQTEKLKEGASSQEAGRFARTAFIRTHWQNNPATPISVNGKNIYPYAEPIDIWNQSYNMITYENLFRARQSGTPKQSFHNVLRQYIQIMDVDLKPDFFLSPETTGFRVLENKLVGYMNGIKRQEIMMLDEGVFEKNHENGELTYVRFLQNETIDQNAEKRFSFEDGHATYTIRNGKMNGLYREFDAQGKQILEVPMENGRANGTGWQIKENGEKEITVFKNAWSTNYLRRKYRRSNGRE